MSVPSASAGPGHRSGSSAVASQERAYAHSRNAVAREMPSASAALVDRQAGEEAMAGHLGRGRVLLRDASRAASTSSTRSGSAPGRGHRRRGRSSAPRRRAGRPCGGGRGRPGSAAWRRPRRGRSRCGRRTTPHPAGGKPRAPKRWRRANARQRSPASRAAASRFSSS